MVGGVVRCLFLYANNGHNVSLPPLTTLMKRRVDRTDANDSVNPSCGFTTPHLEGFSGGFVGGFGCFQLRLVGMMV